MIRLSPSGEPPAEPTIREVEIAMIRLDNSAQPRESLNTDKTREYAEAMGRGDKFPPLVVFFDGSDHWLADGFHRHYAAQQAGRSRFLCKVFAGGLRDAILYSVGANAKHGLPRSDEDKRRAVMRLLNDEEWSKWSDREIGRRCHVSGKTIAKHRGQAAKADTADFRSMDRTFVHPKTGKPTTMKTASINAGRKVGGDETKEITSETVAPQGVEGGDEPASAEKEIITIAEADRDADAIQSAWDRSGDEGRALFLARNNLQFQAKASEDNGATGSDRMFPADSMTGEVSRVDAGRTASATSERMDVTGGESAATSLVSHSADEGAPRPGVECGAEPRQTPVSNSAPSSSQVAEQTGADALLPSASVAPFHNPRCQHSDTCHFAKSRDCCHDCLMDWAKRPKDEQIRLWAEANEAARATA